MIRQENNIRLDLQEVGCEGMDLIDLVRDRDRWKTFVNAIVNLWIP